MSDWREALKALAMHKLRSALALLGIVVGVAAVVVTAAVGEGSKAQVLASIDEMGEHLLMVHAGEMRIVHGRPRPTGLVTTLTPQDAKMMIQADSSIVRAAPVESRSVRIKAGNAAGYTYVTATTPAFLHIRKFTVARGRGLTKEDLAARRRVALLGSDVATSIFPDSNPLGQTLFIEKVPFIVVGTLARKGVETGGRSEDDQILIPLSTGLRRLWNQSHISSIVVQASSDGEIPQASAAIEALLRRRHRLPQGQQDDFSLRNQIELRQAKAETARTFSLMILGVAAVSLLVGGVGVMGVMLIGVRERTVEIGLRRAVGATQRRILRQFLIEAALLGLVGGLAGTALGVALAAGSSWFTTWKLVLRWPLALLAWGVCTAVGLLFGLYPAREAARVDPIVALRTE
ncbi:MAG: ABC transporter permease [Nitrospinae bacterium]|nr:ABC transporter permease [Nitrospinota bacterium]